VVPRGPDFPELSHQINKFAIRGVELQFEFKLQLIKKTRGTISMRPAELLALGAAGVSE
jgi:hypothetical protein